MFGFWGCSNRRCCPIPWTFGTFAVAAIAVSFVPLGAIHGFEVEVYLYT
jgi:hypothetical protein